MAFGIFMHRRDSIYDDVPSERYQFPQQYLRRAQKAVGDWIVYLEPSKVTLSRGYFAVAKVQNIVPDISAPGMYVANIEPGTYMDFPEPVPFRDADGVVETGILNDAGRPSGRAQAAVRPLSSPDFNRIIERGLGSNNALLPRTDYHNASLEVSEEQEPFAADFLPDRAILLTSRAVRDRAFRSSILRAYGSRCAMTGLRLINGGGRAEVEAAHIRSVEARGPDSVNNGLALSGTMHWMFDRGLLSVDDNMRILLSRHINDKATVEAMIHSDRRILLPSRREEHPHPRFLNWHRQNCFKV